jgi:hypothetical protein
MTPVKRTRIIHTTELSMPRDFASFATQMAQATHMTRMAIGMAITVPQAPH